MLSYNKCLVTVYLEFLTTGFATTHILQLTTFLVNCAVVVHYALFEAQTEPKKQNCEQYIKKNERSFGYVSTGDTRRPPKHPTKKPRKVGGIEETWVRTKPKNSTTFLRGRKNNKRKGGVTTENDLHAKQPLFIQKY